ncbi:ceramide synthase 4a [Conger conger]|uniref:ceramide synthase 4a n=1 Tax=Conger conger TaxID=82655 RepID=UPI002A5A8CB0|nr:ceramide synthase 4a [Conger conger]
MEALLDQWLWRQEYWLPPGFTWKDIETRGKSRYPLPRDLWITFPLALGFIVLRYVFERVVALPLSRQLGVRDRIRVRASPVPKLEAFYTQRCRQPSQSEMVTLAQQCGFTHRRTETWFCRRRNQDRPHNTKKFCEACWRFVFYLVAFLAGLASLIDKPWFWDSKECWTGYPHQAISRAQYWYYAAELGFYWSLLLCISVDVKRKDFKEQIIHHIATIFLIGLSYCGNYVRVGTLVMLVHDSSDFLMESAKMVNYAGWRKTCDTLFVAFAAVFLVTRLVVFPFKVIHSTLFSFRDSFDPFFGYYFFNGLLLVLQALHIFWAWLIIRMIYKFVFKGKVERDERSDEESEVEEEDEDQEMGDEDDDREESSWDQRKDALNSKFTALADNCVLKNLTKQRNSASSRFPKAR